ncbi:Lecithin:cholesterol acyltransferase [Punctularia strigosozonata HHB-11173 SS5]|uniref:Lecithin:cholesterol acyltransferase n=1 Tax=Punctularia strigosozonata (strain HHB-11173) TaxID=741275 RepID=UPI0004416BFD|nr:Lecithin:cholesterol acyltransferase [Punctularia strigosozonata HHB-11173 SS5]EIN06718.1 Lecithin:cholesterol acyltransferase [Punctularia strigosozonata HHB-11173 SS5]
MPNISLEHLPFKYSMDFSRVETEWQRFRSSIPEVWKLNTDGREFQVGEQIKAQGLTAQYPVVLVPGVISTGLESWSTESEYRDLFRVKVWGGFPMIQQVMFDKDRWMSTLLLDPYTGLDPPKVKVRSAEGISAASSFIQGYWIWSKIIENLAVVNYDTNNLYLAPYDWRLSYGNLEVRDGYFSKLKANIEGFVKKERKKVVIAAHSMGSTVMKWVESPDHGNGGPQWVENNIEALITIGGTHLGVPKAMAAFLSGEMKDTVQINPYGAYVLERFFSRKERQRLFRSWAGSASMWIKATLIGGDLIWGNGTWAPDDPPDAGHSHGELISFRAERTLATAFDALRLKGVTNETIEDLTKHEAQLTNMTSREGGTWILTHTPNSFQRMMETNYSNGFEKDERQLIRNNADPSKWSNPLEVQLPHAPSMKMYCVYGHGKETERSYWYARGEYEYDETIADAAGAVCANETMEHCESLRPPLDMPLYRSTWIDSEYTDETANPKVINGVKMGEGDGTVSLLSLGAMCVEGWKRKRWNPAGIDVVTVELPHHPTPTIPRGGANTSDHVDILGSTRLNEIILKVATGAGSEIKDNFVSRIREYAAKINWD